ncbi:MAG: DUF4270 family protein [Bacteroidota bacterium]
MRHITQLYMAIFLLSLFWACNDSSVVGLDLVEDEQINIQFTDGVPFELTTILGEPIETYKAELGNIETINTMLLGRLEDPTFGTTEASLYGQLVLDLTTPPGLDNDNLEVDSIVLVLPYAPDGFYGDTTEEVTIEVYELLERLDENEDYTSADRPMIDESMPLASFQIKPRPRTAKNFLGYRNGTVDSLASTHMRIPLDKSLGERLLAVDTTVLRNDTLFLDFFKGLHIRMTNANNTMLGIDLSTEDERFGIQSGIFFFYDTADSDENVPFEYFFPFTPLSRYPTVKFPTFEHDYTGTPIESSLDDETAERIYVQGGSGVDVKLTLPDLSILEGTIINQAKLELTVVQIGDAINIDSPAPEQLLLFTERDDQLELINDFEVGVLSIGGNLLATAVGGDLMVSERDSTLSGYSIFLSDQLQDIINGKADNELLLRVAPPINQSFRIRQDATKGKRINWAVLGSDNHPEERLRARLTVTYTDIN